MSGARVTVRLSVSIVILCIIVTSYFQKIERGVASVIANAVWNLDTNRMVDE